VWVYLNQRKGEATGFGTKSTLAQSFDPHRLELEVDFTFLKRSLQGKEQLADLHS
jgi:hypothetical protein